MNRPICKRDHDAADRALTRACHRVVDLFRSGANRADVLPVLEAAVITAAVLTEEPA